MSTDVVAEDRRRDRRTFLVVLAVIALLVGALYVGAHVLTGDRLPQGSRVGDVRVGGLSPAAARRKVSEATAERARRPVLVEVLGRRVRIDPVAVGLEVDVSGSVAQVPVGRSWDPQEMWDQLAGSVEVPLLPVVVGDGLERRVDRLADSVDVRAVEGDVRFEGGRARAVYPRTGRLLDRPAAVRAIQAAFPSTGEPVALPVQQVSPAVSTAEVSRTMDELANRAVSGPVTYRFGRGVVVVLRPDDVGAVLGFTESDGRLRPRVDAARLWSRFGVVDRFWASRPTDPRRFRVGDAGPELARSEVAAELRRRVVADFLAVVRRDGRERVVDLPVRPVS